MKKTKTWLIILGLGLILISVPTWLVCNNYQLEKYNIRHPETIYMDKCGVSNEGELKCNPQDACFFALPGMFLIGLIMFASAIFIPTETKNKRNKN